jgi:hypothetical protein
MTRLIRPMVFAGVLAAAAWAPAVYAQQPTGKPAATPAAGAKPAQGAPAARQLYGSGETKFKAGDYAGALVDFQAADSIKAAPQAARYIGLCQDKLGHYQDAVTAYERFLANVPAKMTKEADETKKRVDEIKAMPGHLHIETTPPGATVAIDGKPQTSPTPLDVDVPAGKHTLHVTGDSEEPQDKDVDVAYGSKQDVSLQLASQKAPPLPPAAPIAEAPASPPAAPPPPPPEPRSKVPAFVTGGLAIVAAGVGTVFGVMALSDKSDFDNNPTSSKADDGENHALIADMAFGVAITLGVTSVVLFLTNDESSEPSKASQARLRSLASSNGEDAHPRASVARSEKKSSFTLTPTPIVTPHGGGAGAVLRF